MKVVTLSLAVMLLTGAAATGAQATIVPCSTIYEPSLWRERSCGASEAHYTIPGVETYIGAMAPTYFSGETAVLWWKAPRWGNWKRAIRTEFNGRGRASVVWNTPLRTYRQPWKLRWRVPSRDEASRIFEVWPLGD